MINIAPLPHTEIHIRCTVHWWGGGDYRCENLFSIASYPPSPPLLVRKSIMFNPIPTPTHSVPPIKPVPHESKILRFGDGSSGDVVAHWGDVVAHWEDMVAHWGRCCGSLGRCGCAKDSWGMQRSQVRIRHPCIVHIDPAALQDHCETIDISVLNTKLQ